MTDVRIVFPGRKKRNHWVFASFFARRALAPIPRPWFATLPSGAWGTTTCAACEGLCRGWIGVATGESFGVGVSDMAVIFCGQ